MAEQTPDWAKQFAAAMGEHMSNPSGGSIPPYTPDADAISVLMSVEKLGDVVPMSEETMMNYGLIPDTRPPVHIPWRRRLRWRVTNAVDSVRLRVGARIAGVDLRDWEKLS